MPSVRVPYRGPLKAIVLDWAGTTVDYGSCAPAAAFVSLFATNGVSISNEEARGPMGRQKRDHIAALLAEEEIAARWAAAHEGTAATESDIDRLYDEFVPIQIASLGEYAELVPGTLEAVEAFRRRGLKIGSSTGYNREMMDVVLREAKQRGFEPDCVVVSDDVPAGRPAPWMALENAQRLDVYPMSAIVKVGDTAPDVWEGRNAGMWTVAVAATGNEVGLSEAEANALPRADLERRVAAARRRLEEAGAHYVVDGIADVPPLLDEIEARLREGETP